MKHIRDIQNLIKEKTKLYIFIDYENFIMEFLKSYDTETFNPRYIRIMQNFAKCDFINMCIITDKKTKAKDLKKLQKHLVEIEFCLYDEDFTENMCNKFHNLYTPLYLGDRVDVINKVKDLNGYTISINPLNKKIKKIIDFQIPKNKFEEILIETNNICL